MSMKVAKVDWESIDSVYVIDEKYEHIKAPKWVDLSAPTDTLVVDDDEAWFCRPDCNHPKTLEDLILLKLASKVQRSTTVSDILPTSDQSRRDSNLKRRLGLLRPLLSSKKGTKRDKLVVEDGENVNPNLHSTRSHQYNHMKSVFQSSTDKKNKKKENDKSPCSQKHKSTLSARNLFGGRDMVNQIAELCSELKRLGKKTSEREILLAKEGEKCGDVLKKSNVMEDKDVKPGSKKKVKETENTTPTIKDSNKNKKNINKDFAVGQNVTRTPPFNNPTSSSRLQVRGILQELDQKNKKLSKEERVVRNTSPLVFEREGSTTVNVFWFLKPCTNLSS